MSFPQAMIAPADPICITWHHQHIQRICWVLGKKRTRPAPLDLMKSYIVKLQRRCWQPHWRFLKLLWRCSLWPLARKSQPHQHAVCCHHPGAKRNSTKRVAPHKKCCLSAVLCLFTTCFFDMELNLPRYPWIQNRGYAIHAWNILVTWFAKYLNLPVTVSIM